MPSAGNHEYYTAGASGYFGAAAGDPQEGYYSYGLGSWHVVVLNSNCAAVGGCGAGSPQGQWLREDLGAHPSACTAAYFHHPRFSSSGVGNNSAVMPFWETLHDAGAEVVLNGHAPNYERFAPQTPGGQANPEGGIRQFVVGTGGRSLNSFDTVRVNSEARIAYAYGVIKLTLHPEGYDWQFVTAPGGTDTDSGSAGCHGAPSSSPADTTAPTATSTVPKSNATRADPAVNVTATFSEAMAASSINGTTFKLIEKGSAAKLAAAISYDSGTHAATLDPTDPLRTGIT
jgi:hypothetical protein